MAKTLLKMILGVLLLSGIFFFALQFWEKNRVRQAQTPSNQAENEKAIKDVSVNATTEGATIEIKDVTGSTYAISNEDKGFLINFPDLSVSLAQKSIPLPHPMIESIDVIESGSKNQAGAKVKVILSTRAKYKTRQEGGSLFIDLEREIEVVPTAPPVAQKKKAMKSPKLASRKKKPSRKASGSRFASKPPTQPSRKKTSPASTAQEDEFLAQLGIVDAPSSDSLGSSPSNEAAALPQDGGSNDLFGADGSSGSDILPLTDDPAANSQVAMNAPIQKNFDPGQVTANLPSVTDLQVVNDGGITKVRVIRGAKTKYKVFPKRNPNRLVVDIQNAVNQLPAEMGGFSGTRVDKVRTTQFVSADGTISRIELFLNNIPEIDRTSINNSGNFLEIPIP